MRKLLRPQDIFLLGLTTALDIFEEIRDPFRTLSKSYENMYGWAPKKYKRHEFNHLVWRSLKAGYIEKVERNGNIYIRVTSEGEKRVRRDFPILRLQRKPWDGKWRMIMFDIQELERRKREDLRRKLRELGFGMLQESVFITPHDIIKDFSEYVDNIGLHDSVYILEVSHIVAGKQRELARKVWRLDELNEKYLEIFRKVEEIENSHLTALSGRTGQLNGKDGLGRGGTERDRRIMRIKEIYLSILLSDPFLPKALLPENWWGDKAGKLIKKLI